MSTPTFPTEPLPADYFTADHSDILRGVAISFIVIQVIGFSFRVFARKLKGMPWGLDDAIMVPALLCNLGVCAICLLSLRYGVGRHTLAVIKADPSWGEEGRSQLAKLSMIALPITFNFAVTFSKIAILNLFLRIFMFGAPRYITILVGVIVVLQCIVCNVVILMQCSPISLVWTTTIRKNCIGITNFSRISGVPNVTTDLIMLILPMPQIWRLNAPPRVKVGITVAMLTASIGVISSCLRFVEFFRTNIFADPLWHAVNFQAYTIAEPGTIFLAACFVTYRPLFRYLSADSFVSRIWSTLRTGPKSNPSGDAARQDPEALEGDSSNKKKRVRGFNSILLSAISRNSRHDHTRPDTKQGTESTIEMTKSNQTDTELESITYQGRSSGL